MTVRPVAHRFGDAIGLFDQALNPSERRVIGGLTTPQAIQAFLDDLHYSDDPFYRCPLRVIKERTAHCFDGALFGAAMLRRLGDPPLILDILPNHRDDDHLLALFKRKGRHPWPGHTAWPWGRDPRRR